ncbi:uncharacterized protein LOC142579271 [Dermacentor variabilis]|uniref:uncharacterized protein LOC142579271 n=1 Tax=Dermacentor variabilis TaxID=34621 RepID=UPI003F5B3838
MLALEAMSSVRQLNALVAPVATRMAGVPRFRPFAYKCRRCMASQPRRPSVAVALSCTSRSRWSWQLQRAQQPSAAAAATRWRGGGSCRPAVPCRWAHTTSSLRDDDDAAGAVGTALQDKWPYRDRNITVTTCADLYKSWRGTRRGYSSAPTNGLPVPVSYVHTGLDRSERAGPTPAAQTEGRPSRRPVVVILTGAPGSYKDFAHLIPFLDRQGVDVVAPAWPDLAFSRQSGCWWHSSAEKTDLALDFLRAVGVTECDMLVAHSSGAYPAMRLICREDGLKVKSLTLLAPAGYSQINVMRPDWFTLLLSRLYQQPLTQRMVNAMALAFLVATRHPLRRDVDNVLLAMKAMLYADKAQFKKDAEEVAARKLPVLVAISDNDKLIDLPVSLETVDILGGSPESTWYYDQEKRLKKRGNGNGPVKTLRFEKGTHYLFTRCADVINQEILDLLKSTTKL